MASLYVHIPFCERKCIYCDFYSIESRTMTGEFLHALLKEIELSSGHAKNEAIETLFFGGGTPSLLEPVAVETILGALRSSFHFGPHPEITLEANPGTVDERKLEGYLKAGINRISFGVQSFFDDELSFLGRIHSSAQASSSIALAQRAGFDNINLDMIYALPNQTFERWQENLRRAVAVGTHHISAYSLIIEDKTPLARMVRSKQVSPLPTEAEAEMYDWTMRFLGGEGFDHYEVSNYARPGRKSAHNCNYWNHSNYLGFGPSAHSFWGNGSSGHRRWWNVANVSSYVEKLARAELPVAGEERLDATQLFEEAVMLGLRNGLIDLKEIERCHGVDLLQAGRVVIEEAVAVGLAKLRGAQMSLTEKGFLVCDEITRTLVSLPKSA